MSHSADSPLLEPVLWGDAGFKILDELQIPEKIEYIEVRDIDDALAAVRDMKTRAFGQVLTFLYSGALLALRSRATDPQGLMRELSAMTDRFCAARPTFDFRGLGADLSALAQKAPAAAAIGEWFAEQARAFSSGIVRARRARARHAAMVLPARARVLTHCNVSGELVAVAAYCREFNKAFSVVATETRPYLQGTRLTAWELARAGVEVALIPDSAVAQVMARGDVDAVVVGADRVAQNGDIINKIGTYPLAVAANAYGVPFIALIQNPRSTLRGSDVPIEERPASELLSFQQDSLVQDCGGVSVRYPAFDMTPARLISHWVGFEDHYTLEGFRRRFQTEAAAGDEFAAKVGKYLLLYGLPQVEDFEDFRSELASGRVESLLVPEMRPELFGARVVVRQARSRNLPVTLISDSMMGTLFANGEIGRLCWFYDCDESAGFTGPCGSLLALQLARAHAVPIDARRGASTARLEDRDVSTFLGHRVIPEGAAVYPLRPEPVSADLISGGGSA